MTIYISAREKKEKKKITKKDNATNSFSDSSEVDAKPLKVLHNGITNDKEDKEAKRQKGFTLEQCVSAIRERTKEEGVYECCFFHLNVTYTSIYIFVFTLLPLRSLQV